MSSVSRKKFLEQLSLGSLGAFGLSSGPSLITKPYQQKKDKLGVALVGLGGYARGQLAPALLETEHCRLTGIVSGTPEKRIVWADKYNLPDKNIYNYANMHQMADNPDIDIAYIVLPNAMHADFAIIAAEAGKHVICEKPLATSVEDAQRIVDACNKNRVKLSVGYRLHFEPFNRKIMQLGQNKTYGTVKQIKTGFGFEMNWPWQWRLDKSMAGGGSLMDVGIYSIQGCIYAPGEIPSVVEAKAISGEAPKFNEVNGGIEWTFRYPSGIVAKCESSYMKSMNYITVEAENGKFGLEPAFSYGGLRGFTPKGDMNLQNINQQAAQMDDFARRIKNDEKSPVPGETGLRDVAIMMDIYKAAETNREVEIDPVYREIDLVSEWKS